MFWIWGYPMEGFPHGESHHIAIEIKPYGYYTGFYFFNSSKFLSQASFKRIRCFHTIRLICYLINSIYDQIVFPYKLFKHLSNCLSHVHSIPHNSHTSIIGGIQVISGFDPRKKLIPLRFRTLLGLIHLYISTASLYSFRTHNVVAQAHLSMMVFNSRFGLK